MLHLQERSKEGSKKISAITENLDSNKVMPRSQSYEKEEKSSNRNGAQPSGQVSIGDLSGVIKINVVQQNPLRLESLSLFLFLQGNQVSKKLELKPSVQELAAHAASLAMAEVSKNIKAPKSAYEFENSWRSFSGDRALQTQLLKV